MLAAPGVEWIKSPGLRSGAGTVRVNVVSALALKAVLLSATLVLAVNVPAPMVTSPRDRNTPTTSAISTNAARRRCEGCIHLPPYALWPTGLPHPAAPGARKRRPQCKSCSLRVKDGRAAIRNGALGPVVSYRHHGYERRITGGAILHRG